MAPQNADCFGRVSSCPARSHSERGKGCAKLAVTPVVAEVALMEEVDKARPAACSIFSVGFLGDFREQK